MGKKYLLFVFGLFVLSCSNDEENSNDETDPIVGKWKPLKTYTLFEDGVSSLTVFYSECEQNSRYSFLSNGNLKVLLFRDNMVSQECDTVVELSEIIGGRWKRYDQKNYGITKTYRNNETGEMYSETEIANITFESPNIMKEQYSVAGVIGFSYTEYEKIE